MVGLADTLGVEVTTHFLEDILLTGLSQVCLHHFAGIGLGIIAREAELLRRP